MPEHILLTDQKNIGHSRLGPTSTPLSMTSASQEEHEDAFAKLRRSKEDTKATKIDKTAVAFTPSEFLRTREVAENTEKIKKAKIIL